MTAKNAKQAENTDDKTAEARARLAGTGRNDVCPCGSGKKYKKCHLNLDQDTVAVPVAAPDADELLAAGWRLFEQRRPGAAEKSFRAALALRPEWADALAGIGLARLQSGDNEGARKEFREVQRVTEPVAAELRKAGAKDAFQRKEAQALVRSCHALGCLAFDEKNYEEALVELERVYAVDEGPVGTEARLIAGIALVKVNRAADAVPVLEAAAHAEAGAGRAPLSLALAQFLAGNREAAEKSLEKAITANANLVKVLLGRLPKRAANLAAATPGSKEEAYGYAQTYGDAWEAPAKKFLEEYMEARAALHKATTSEVAPATE